MLSPTPVHASLPRLGTHVTLDFDLVQDGKQLVPTADQCAAIRALFPSCFAIATGPPYLIVRCETLPPKPWPVTVARVPLFLTSDRMECPMDYAERAQGLKLVVDADIEVGRPVRCETFVKIFEGFERIGARVEREQWFGVGFRILAVAEPWEDWKMRLPSFINDKFVGYVFGEEMMYENALGRKLPMGAAHDDELRPGVKITTGRNFELTDEGGVMTTSGICVESPNGKKYLTVASHGFPAGIGSEVMHPHSKGQLLGTIAKVYGGTDIALCELKPEVSCLRETFSTPKPFQDLADSSQLNTGDRVFMDTPYNGRCEGNLMIVEMSVVSSDDTLADETQYAVCLYVHFGTGADRIFDGCCGSVIWNEKHDVLGYFRYQSGDRSQLCYCPTFMQLREAGYKIAES